MNATMVASGTKAVPPVVSSIQDIPLGKIRESKTNPRRFFDEAKLAELADNIRQHGVLQPILLRPLPEGEAGTFELVAGTRRYRASKLAKRESIPATVRELTDAQALEQQVIDQMMTACPPSRELYLESMSASSVWSAACPRKKLAELANLHRNYVGGDELGERNIAF